MNGSSPQHFLRISPVIQPTGRKMSFSPMWTGMILLGTLNNHLRNSAPVLSKIPLQFDFQAKKGEQKNSDLSQRKSSLNLPKHWASLMNSFSSFTKMRSVSVMRPEYDVSFFHFWLLLRYPKFHSLQPTSAPSTKSTSIFVHLLLENWRHLVPALICFSVWPSWFHSTFSHKGCLGFLPQISFQGTINSDYQELESEFLEVGKRKWDLVLAKRTANCSFCAKDTSVQWFPLESRVSYSNFADSEIQFLQFP
ncbi:uncharacterized protein LOC127549120 isoform X3 [Antechinus flavipes]|uniref:uncharacterized protein LOC127549120 isoform X3 n=1 Tax=Antechinus flavipes TaxID=38775 RepID=UPI002235808C|nr:uncharacterized protein LOC127549120 isoform X3 [Antechinus flavipes]